MLKRTPPTVSIQQTYHYEEIWGDLQKGDIVKVKGKRGDFRFISVALDNSSGEVRHVSLYEIKPGRVRSIDPEQIIIPSKKVLERQRKTRHEK